MRKVFFALLSLAVLLSSCGNDPVPVPGVPSDTVEVSSMVPSDTVEVSSMESIYVESIIDKKLEDALDTIESATNDAVSRIEQAVSSVGRVPAPVQSGASSSKPEATSSQIKTEPIIIPLNIETKRGDGTLTIVQAKMTFNQYNHFILDYTTSDKLAVMPVESETKLIGKSGKVFPAEGMGGVGSNGSIFFPNVTDLSDLSQVTLTYAFEGFDPVTVTFDIPIP